MVQINSTTRNTGVYNNVHQEHRRPRSFTPGYRNLSTKVETLDEYENQRNLLERGNRFRHEAVETGLRKSRFGNRLHAHYQRHFVYEYSEYHHLLLNPLTKYPNEPGLLKHRLFRDQVDTPFEKNPRNRFGDGGFVQNENYYYKRKDRSAGY